MSSDDKIDKLNEAALAVTLCEKGASFHALFELCLSLGIHFPAPTLVPLAWKQELPVNETILCPASGATYIIGRTLGTDSKMEKRYTAFVIPPKRLEKSVIAFDVALDLCREAVELHRNTKMRENLL